MFSKLNGYWKQKITLLQNIGTKYVCVCVYTSKYLHYGYVKHDIYTINEIWEALFSKISFLFHLS